MRRLGLKTINYLKGLSDRRAPLAGVAFLLVVGFITWVTVQSVNKAPFTDPYRVKAVVPADAPILRPGDEVRVAGRRSGQVRDVEPARQGRLVIFELEKGPVGSDGEVTVRQRGFSGSVYLLVRRGSLDRPLPENATIPLAQTGTTEELASVVADFDAEARRALKRTLTAYGGGFVGRGEDLNKLLADLAPLARDATPVMEASAPGEGELSGFLQGLDRTARGFSSRPGELAGLVGAARGTFDTTARRGAEVGRMIDELYPFEITALETLPAADALLADTASASEELTPAIDAIADSLPDVNRLLQRAGGLRALSSFARAGRPVLARGEPLVRELRPVASSLAPLVRPFEPFATYLDPYRADMVDAMRIFNEFSKFRYSEGKASGEHAVRFGPVFTCHAPRDPYPDPGETLQQRAANLAEACQ